MKYIKVFQISMQNMLEYRSDFLFTLLSRFFPVIIQIFMWTAVYRASAEKEVMGYTYIQMMTYTILSVFVSSILSVDIHYKIAGDIKDGVLSKYLILPLDYYRYQAAGFLGGKISETVLSSAGIILVCLVMRRRNLILLTAAEALIFVLFGVLALLLQFVMHYCLACLAFWFGECGGVFTAVGVIARIVSGAVFPLDIFGGVAVSISKVFPFYYTTYFLTNILLGKSGRKELLFGLTVIAAWIIVLFLIGKMLWNKGQKRYIAAGG